MYITWFHRLSAVFEDDRAVCGTAVGLRSSFVMSELLRCTLCYILLCSEMDPGYGAAHNRAPAYVSVGGFTSALPVGQETPPHLLGDFHVL